MGLRKHGPLKFTIFPGLSVVRGYFDPADGARPGPSQTSDPVESPGSQLLSARGPGDYGLGAQFAIEPARFAIGILALVYKDLVLIGFSFLQVGPVHHLDSSQPFY